jgi:hypothetical protein
MNTSDEILGHSFTESENGPEIETIQNAKTRAENIEWVFVQL